ncbi:hypothetical protein HYALB_00007341 [Hymenoscyphus albidus]|uniref:Cytochrome P450 n=1 Tax=Hymenoscyphus albidus TaxID=595503 RepID=A0A9N9LBJ2_9HELO|nr:hypothetical protein HYALB_00007341 [Hymenoscyphus albidus]
MDFPSLTAIAAASAAIGVASHLGYFIKGEHHVVGPRLVAAAFLIPSAIYISILRGIGEDGYLEAAKIATVATFSYTTALFSSIVIYRLFFHALKKFPGPLSWKISKLCHTSYLIKNGPRDFIYRDRLHKKYGETGPNEISITAPKAVTQILGPKFRKSIWYECIAIPDFALNLERDKATHDSRRKIWDRAFSTKALRDYEGRVRQYTDQLISQLNERSGKAVNACEWFNFYAFDIMGDMAFGTPFDMVKNGKAHSVITLMTEGMANLGPLTPIIWILPILKAIPGLAGATKAFIAHNKKQVEWRKTYTPDSPDLYTYLINASKESPDPIHKDPRWLIGDCGLVIVAGSDTTTATLSHIFYNLARYPQVQEKLRKELSTFYEPGSESEFKGLAEATYLNGIINEALRLHPATPSGLTRLTPPEGVTIGDTYIPGDVTVSTPFYTVGRLESCFKSASEFIPERWGEKPELVLNKSVFLPFSTGSAGCVGKQLALMELRNVTARIISDFDVRFAPGEDGTGIIEKSTDIFTMALEPMMLVFERRIE